MQTQDYRIKLAWSWRHVGQFELTINRLRKHWLALIYITYSALNVYLSKASSKRYVHPFVKYSKILYLCDKFWQHLIFCHVKSCSLAFNIRHALLIYECHHIYETIVKSFSTHWIISFCYSVKKISRKLTWVLNFNFEFKCLWLQWNVFSIFYIFQEFKNVTFNKCGKRWKLFIMWYTKHSKYLNIYINILYKQIYYLCPIYVLNFLYFFSFF